jgi:hypothetical protein
MTRKQRPALKLGDLVNYQGSRRCYEVVEILHDGLVVVASIVTRRTKTIRRPEHLERVKEER